MCCSAALAELRLPRANQVLLLRLQRHCDTGMRRSQLSWQWGHGHRACSSCGERTGLSTGILPTVRSWCSCGEPRGRQWRLQLKTLGRFPPRSSSCAYCFVRIAHRTLSRHQPFRGAQNDATYPVSPKSRLLRQPEPTPPLLSCRRCTQAAARELQNTPRLNMSIFVLEAYFWSC